VGWGGAGGGGQGHAGSRGRPGKGRGLLLRCDVWGSCHCGATAAHATIRYGTLGRKPQKDDGFRDRRTVLRPGLGGVVAAGEVLPALVGPHRCFVTL
jgi:hypothetical protein